LSVKVSVQKKESSLTDNGEADSKFGNRKFKRPLIFRNSLNFKPNKFDELFSRDEFTNSYQYPIPEFPMLIDIEPTNKCNLRCVFCNINVMKRKTGFMDMALYKKFLDEIEGKCFFLKFSRWGEPFMHPEIYNMFAMAKERGINTHVTTNGILIDPKHLENVDTIYFSFQGLTKEEYAKIRCNKYYDEIVTTIDTIMEHEPRPHVRLSTSVLDESPEEIEAFVKEWENRVDVVQIGKTIFSWVHDERFEHRQTFNYRTEPCNDVRVRLNIDYDGLISACCADFDRFLIIGDLRRQTIKEAWEGEKLQRLRQSMIDGSWKQHPFCSKCIQQW